MAPKRAIRPPWPGANNGIVRGTGGAMWLDASVSGRASRAALAVTVGVMCAVALLALRGTGVSAVWENGPWIALVAAGVGDVLAPAG